MNIKQFIRIFKSRNRYQTKMLNRLCESHYSVRGLPVRYMTYNSKVRRVSPLVSKRLDVLDKWNDKHPNMRYK